MKRLTGTNKEIAELLYQEQLELSKENRDVERTVQAIIEDVKERGDEALRDYSVPDAAIRKAYRTQRDADHYGSLSPFMRAAVLAAYTDEGKAWIDELMDFVHENESLVRDCFARCMPAVKLLRHRAGTLIWADFRGLGLSELELERFFLSAGVEPDLGSKYGAAGTGFLRLQIGMPRSELTGALTRLEASARKCGFAQEVPYI